MPTKSTTELLITMQLTDSSFPGGSLANSQGLESVVQHHVALHNNHKSNDLCKFIEMSLEQNAYQMLPFVLTTHQLAASNKDYIETKRMNFAQLDLYCDSLISNDVTRRSSVNQGRCFHRVIMETYPHKLDEINYILPPVNYNNNSFHYAPVFGLLTGILEISLETVERIYLRNILRDILSAAARLNIIGPMEGSRLQSKFFGTIESLITELKESQESTCHNQNKSNDISFDNFQIPNFYNNITPVQTSPIIEFMQSRHDLLYTRLFNS
eukprot:gene10078-13544_t